MSARPGFLVLLLACLLAASGLRAGGPSLVLIERRSERDRNLLLESGLPLVAQLSSGHLALGELESLSAKTRGLGYELEVLDLDCTGRRYSLAILHGDATPELLGRCGEPIWRDDNQLILRRLGGPDFQCLSSRDVSLHDLVLKPLLPARPPPPAYREPRPDGAPGLDSPALVQEMVDSLGASQVLDDWNAVVSAAPSRYSTNPGCQLAAEMMRARFSALGLATAYQDHTAGHAPNVIATLEGTLAPAEVFIAIGHLDDRPDPGPAPGANDNGSGSAMLLSVAEVMSRYRFERSVKFLSVTGEEQGMYGSRHYACEALSAGEQIEAVLNADMIGYEGDGTPVPEDLDVNYDETSRWLGELMATLASDYSTGCVADAFLCPSHNNSDHSSFWRYGWSAILGITDSAGACGHGGSYPFYHTSEDTIANCGDPTFFVGSVKAYLATLAHLARPVCRNPQPPRNLVATVVGANHVRLNWEATGERVIYEIYRAPGGCAAGRPFVKVAETGARTFDDTTASAGSSAWVVRARDKHGTCLSAPSACVQAGPSGECLEPPRFAGVGSAADDNSSGCSVTLSWPDVEETFCGNGVVFNIYRSPDPGFEPEPRNRIASCVTGNSFTDTGVDPLTSYTWVVRAEDDSTGHAGPCGGNEEHNEVRLTASASGPPDIHFTEDFEAGLGRWNAQRPWELSTAAAHGGTSSVHSGNRNRSCGSLTLNQAIELPASAPALLSYWVSYNMETCADGVQVQLSADGGTSWQLLEPEGGYGGAATATCSERLGTAAFSGEAGAWTRHKSDLGAWAGQSVRLRFVMATDDRDLEGGLFLDDIRITSPTSCGTRLSLESHTLSDACSRGGAGDGDGIVDPGEDVILSVAALNDAVETATGVEVRLAASTPGVAVTTDVASLPDIAAGASSWSLPPHLAFSLDGALECGALVELDLTFSSAQKSWNARLPLTVGDFTPGAASTALDERFDAGIPGSWSVQDGFGDGLTWRADDASDPAGCGNPDPAAPVAGGWAAVDSDCAGAVPMDEALITPVLDLSGAASVVLEFDHHLKRFLSESAELDVRSSGTAGVWVNVARWEEDTANPRHERLDLTALGAMATDVEIRWHYSAAEDDLYWYLDNVVVSATGPGPCDANPCLAPLPQEVSPPLSDLPLLLAKNASLCPDGTCLYFGEEPVAEGYNIYEGTLGSWYSHAGAAGNACNAPVTADGGGWLRRSFTPSAGDAYYLATAFNQTGEGTAGNPLADADCSCPP